MLACYRLTLVGQWTQTNCGHTRIMTDLNHTAPSSKMRSDRILPSYHFDNNYVVCIPDRQDWEDNSVTLNDDVICYTDGSKIDTTGLTGAGVFNWTDSEEYFFPTGRVCTVYQTEMYAILQCARLESLRVRDNASIAICSDSQAALKSLSVAKVTSALVAEMVQALRQLAIFNSLRLVWVPGHRGIHGNEMADALARKASAMPFIGPEPFTGITVTMIQREVHLWAVNEQYRLWQNTAKCQQAKHLVKQPKTRLTMYALKLSRKDLRVLVGLLTGHADLNRHLTLMQVHTDELCPLMSRGGGDHTTLVREMLCCN